MFYRDTSQVNPELEMTIDLVDSLRPRILETYEHLNMDVLPTLCRSIWICGFLKKTSD